MKDKRISFQCKYFCLHFFPLTFLVCWNWVSSELTNEEWWIQFSVRVLLFFKLIIIGPYENLHQIRFWIAICFGMHFQDIQDFRNINISRCVDVNITTHSNQRAIIESGIWYHCWYYHRMKAKTNFPFATDFLLRLNYIARLVLFILKHEALIQPRNVLCQQG